METKKPQWELALVSSLAKVFPDEDLTAPPYSQGSVLRSEIFSFQLAYRAASVLTDLELRVVTESELNAEITIRQVGLVPSEYPNHAKHDDYVLRTTPGLYPDPLYSSQERPHMVGLPGQWRALWITVQPSNSTTAGNHKLRLQLHSKEEGLLGEQVFELEVIPATLPPQTLIRTEWFHTDCIARYYQTEVFSDRYWSLVRQYVQTAVQHGINMILTPLFTPPLDTQVGGERLTVQLVDVTLLGEGQYGFDFTKLNQWVDMCLEAGVEYIEFSHLFTQWGAKHAPKIMAIRDGRQERVFGWETDAYGSAYSQFLKQFLPELKAWIDNKGITDRCFFHISDEPGLKDLEKYEQARTLLHECIQDDIQIIDALSDYEFYAKGLVGTPIPGNNHVEEFHANGVDPLWTYYCNGQWDQVSNRFFSMPGERTRIIGMQLYKFKLQGFLHWGYNFWNSQYSLYPIDPYQVTDAGYAFPSGDSFLVYPGPEGPVGSIRLMQMAEAVQDMRALQLLESLVGREEAGAVMESGLKESLTFMNYPHDASWLLQRREDINAAIKKAL
ncbi:DUF4091 domain-containing protein [Paenibacillus marinisediminis]